jgi:hypothetical protein
MVGKIAKMTLYCRKMADWSTLQKMAESRVAKWLAISQNDRNTVANHKND